MGLEEVARRDARRAVIGRAGISDAARLRSLRSERTRLATVSRRLNAVCCALEAQGCVFRCRQIPRQQSSLATSTLVERSSDCLRLSSSSCASLTAHTQRSARSRLIGCQTKLSAKSAAARLKSIKFSSRTALLLTRL